MVITVQLVHATEGPSQHAEHNELRNHTLNVKACYEGKGCLQTLTALSCSRPDPMTDPHKFAGSVTSRILAVTLRARENIVPLMYMSQV